MSDLIVLAKALSNELYHLPTATDEQAATCMDAADLLFYMLGLQPVEPSDRVAAVTEVPFATALEAENKRLREALEPFAKIAPGAEITDKRDGDCVHRQQMPDGSFMELSKDDFRRAQAAQAEVKE